MLRIKSLLAFVMLFGFGMHAIAAQGGGNIQRGGLGFLFPDHNSFANVGQFATARAIGVEIGYTRSTAATPTQSLFPSVVYGNGTIGLGAYASRTGTAIMTPGGADLAGLGFGLNMLKGRMTLGVEYEKPLSQVTSSGTVTASLTLNPPNRKGISLGVSYSRALTSAVNSLGAGLGYAFSGMAALEVDLQIPNLTSASNFNLQALANLNRGMVYFGGGYSMVKTATTLNGVAGRLGFVLGRSIDFSVLANYFFGTGNPITYGGTFRASF
jgi:hypothetical protein